MKKGGNIDFFKKIEEKIEAMQKAFENDFSKNKPCIYTYLFYTVVFIAICVLLSFIINSPLGLYNVQKYFFVITIPLIILFIYVLNVSNQLDLAYTYGSIIFILGVIGLLIYLYVRSTYFNDWSYYTQYIFLVAIAIFGLSIVFQFIKQYLDRLTGWPGFVTRMLFYIPCMFGDVWNYLMNELHLTPYSTFLLMFLELIIVLSYMYLPNIMDKTIGTKDGMVLLKDTYHLEDGQLTIANSDRLKLNKEVQQTLIAGTMKKYATNYAFSMWLYLNPNNSSQAQNNKEMEIFSYGYKDKNGIQHVKPMIRYYGGGDGKDQSVERNKLIFYFATYPPPKEYKYEKNTFYDLVIPMQKWNHIVINYNRNMVDIYLNGHLERNFVLTDTMPQYSDLDNITVSSDNGLRGGIRNVVYYQHPLSLDQIAYEYNKVITPF